MQQLAPAGGASLAINDQGMVVGFCDQGSILWHSGAAYRVTTLVDMTGWQSLSVAAINEYGQVAGSGVVEAGSKLFRKRLQTT